MNDNYPPGTCAGDPRAPWNEPDVPEWLEAYEGIELSLPAEPNTPQDAARYVGNLIDELEFEKRQLERYAADGCFRRNQWTTIP